jgi:myo-inositol catabolism protein IolC
MLDAAQSKRDDRTPYDQIYARDLIQYERMTLFLLAFDHRRSLRGLLGSVGEATIRDAKRIAFEGLVRARADLDASGRAGLLIDEHYGADVLELARDEPIVTAVACERSGQDEFQFEYGEDFAAHIERFDPALVKALVRFNPDGDRELNRRQVERLRRLVDWLTGADRELLFELLVPPTPAQLRSVGDDRDRFDAELRPELVCRAVIALQDAGVEAAVWKIEGLERRADCERVAATCRREGRDAVGCLILGRGASVAKVEHWLRVAAPVAGFDGFAVGRTIWLDPVASHLAGRTDRPAAVIEVARRYRHFVDVYRTGATPSGSTAS